MELPRFGVLSLFKGKTLKKKLFGLLLFPGFLMGRADTGQTPSFVSLWAAEGGHF